MATVTVSPGSTATVDPGTATRLRVVNQGAFDAVLHPIEMVIRPGQLLDLTPEGRAITATVVPGAVTLTVTAVVEVPDRIPAGTVTLSDLDATLAALVESAAAGSVPDGSITLPKLASALQASLAKADSAVQPAGLTASAVGLGNVQNTSDLAKPVSTLTQAALDLKAPTSRTLTASTGLLGGGTLAADRAFAVDFASSGVQSSTQAVRADDARLTDSRTPASHATSHGSAGSDPVTVAQSQVTGLASALALLAPLASPALTGTPTVPTASPGTNTTQAASTAFVAAAVAALVNSSPSALDTLAELATALGNDAAFSTTVTNALAARALSSRLVSAGTGLTGGGDLTADRTLAVSYGTTSGTAAQGNDSRLVAAASGLDSWRLAAGEGSYNRGLIRGGVSISSQQLRLVYFTATRSETIAFLAAGTGTTAAGATPTLIRYGLWTASADGSLTALVASTPSDTTLLASTGTWYPKATSAPYDKVAGQRYALGILVVSGATMPLIGGFSQSGVGHTFGSSPVVASSMTGQADLPSTASPGSMSFSINAPYMECTPS